MSKIILNSTGSLHFSRLGATSTVQKDISYFIEFSVNLSHMKHLN